MCMDARFVTLKLMLLTAIFNFLLSLTKYNYIYFGFTVMLFLLSWIIVNMCMCVRTYLLLCFTSTQRATILSVRVGVCLQWIAAIAKLAFHYGFITRVNWVWALRAEFYTANCIFISVLYQKKNNLQVPNFLYPYFNLSISIFIQKIWRRLKF